MSTHKLLTPLVYVGFALALVPVMLESQGRREAEIQLQAAIHKDLVDGNVREAIRLYEKVVKQFAAERTVAATALLKLGEAHERLGSGEAQNVYARLVREYSDQREQTSTARARLAALRPPSSSNERLPTRRLILDRADESNAVPTRDGRHLIRYNVHERAFELVELKSGRVRSLTGPGPSSPTIWIGGIELSPDEQRIAAVMHFPVPRTDTGSAVELRGAEIRVFNVGDDGSGVPLHRWEPNHHVQIFAWTRANDRLWVIVRRPGGSAEIAWIHAASGALEILKTIPWRPFSQPPSISPDGKFIAYEDTDSRDAPHDVFILATDGSRATRIEHPANDSKPVFAPDGSGILFESNRRDDNRDLWFVPVKDGRPAGEARIVLEDVQPYGHVYRFAENGSVMYYMATNRHEVYTAAIDVARGQVAAPELLPRLNGEQNNAPAYSPDGRFLAHLRNGGRRIVIRDLTTQSEREFPVGGGFTFVLSLDWCPSGKSVVVTGFKQTWVVYLIDVVQGGVKRLPVADALLSRCIGNGDEILYVRYLADAKKPTFPLARRALTTGAETTLGAGASVDYHSATNWPGVARSPDASAIAFVELDSAEARLVVMPSAGGATRTVSRSRIYQVKQDRFHDFLGVMWLPSNDGLLVARRVNGAAFDDSAPEVAFWRVALDGTSETEIGRMRVPPFERAFYGVFHFSLNPDGSRLAFERHAGFVAQNLAIDNMLAFIQSGASAPPSSPRPR